MDTWDTIIIGAGLGGLTAAARLVKAGKRVLIVDKNPHIGGTANVYLRKGFSFPMGPLGFSNPGKIKDILHALNDNIPFSVERVHYCLKAFDLAVVLSRPFPELVGELSRYFPKEAEAVRRFFHDVAEFTSSAVSFDNNIDSNPDNEQFWIPISEYLNQLTGDTRLQCILGSIGTVKPSTSFPLQAAMWNLMCREGIWYPRGGFKAFCDALAQTVAGDSIMLPSRLRTRRENRESSGVIRLGTEVQRIWLEDKRVAGVILADGTAIRSASVISNADYKSAFLKLLGPDSPPDWYEAVSRAKQAGSLFQVCLGIDTSKANLSLFQQASRIIYRRSDRNIPLEGTIDWSREKIDPVVIADQEIEISLLSKEDANLAPEGKAVIVLRTEAPYDHFSRFRSGWRLRIPQYVEYKMSIAHALINEVKKILPHLDESIEVIDTATPITFEDQGGRSQGAVAGWSWNYEEMGDSRPRELVLTPIRGLYMAGYQAFSALYLGGVPTAMESGIRAADAVLNEAGPVKDIRIPLKH